MRIEAPSREDVIDIVRGMRAEDRRELRASTKLAEDEDFEDLVAWTFAQEENSFCAYLDDEPIAVGAVIPFDDDTIQIGMIATDEFPRIAFALTKFVVRRLFPSYAAQGFKRVECLSIDGYGAAHRWIETLGMARLKVFSGVGRGGEDFIQFARDL